MCIAPQGLLAMAQTLADLFCSGQELLRQHPGDSSLVVTVTVAAVAQVVVPAVVAAAAAALLVVADHRLLDEAHETNLPVRRIAATEIATMTVTAAGIAIAHAALILGKFRLLVF